MQRKKNIILTAILTAMAGRRRGGERRPHLDCQIHELRLGYIDFERITGVFNFEVAAPDPDTAIGLAMDDWHAHGSAKWSSCGPAETPRFRVEQESDIPDADTKMYFVSFTVTDRLDAHIRPSVTPDASTTSTAAHSSSR